MACKTDVERAVADNQKIIEILMIYSAHSPNHKKGQLVTGE
jgi:hypothetical protein